jgi:D-threo-aldose 1-dehydrogenase
VSGEPGSRSGRHAARVGLGAAAIPVTRLGLGTSSLGGLFAPVGDEQAAAVVQAALAAGVRYLDTAPLYGLGLSEQRVGAALAGLPREAYTLSTKVGRLVREAGTRGAEPEGPGMWPEAPADAAPVRDYGADGIRRALEESLGRLGVDRVDIAYVHDPDDHMDAAVREAAPALERLREEGMIGGFGFGMNHPEPLVRVVRETSADCVLVAGRYTLLDQSAASELLPLCLERGVGVVVGGVFNSGILARPVSGATFDYAPAGEELLHRAERLAAVCGRHGVALATAAIQFPLGHAAIGCVLAGVRSVAELSQVVTAFDDELPPELWLELVSEGLLPEGVPLPAGSP